MEELIGKIEKLLQEQDGRFTMSFFNGKWTVGMEWGHEAPDSDMAGAASYGMGATLAEATQQIIDEARL